MPRRVITRGGRSETVYPVLVRHLAEILTAQSPYGQPMIEEEEYASGNFRVTIVWDQWDAIPTPDRTSIIRRAYEKAEPDRAAKIALASGWTVPEAHAAGWLPYQIIAAHRATDPVTPEQCRDAMIMEGASGLLDPKRPQLRFATLEEAEAAIARLSARLPGSEPVWVINQELVDVAD